MKKIPFYLLFLFLPFLVFAQNPKAHKEESFVVDWPANEHWKIGDDQEDAMQHVVDYIHDSEAIDKWTEMGNMTSIKGITGLAIDTAMILMFSSAKVTAPEAELTFIEKGEMEGRKWIIFSIEAPRFLDDASPESQLWFVLQGKYGLFTNFVAIRKPKLPEEFKSKWAAFFQKGRLVYK